MDTIEVLKKVGESGAPTQFWYVYGVVVTSLLGLLTTGVILLVKGFLTGFLKDIKETNNKFADSIAQLTTSNSNLINMVKLHDYQIKHLDEDVKELSKRRPQR